MNFYEYDQNNSGGSFIENDKLCHRVIIEAESEKEADEIAKNIGIYFNGVAKGYDCECCGDRWYSPTELNFPYHYGAFDDGEAIMISEKYNLEVVPTSHRVYSDRNKDIVFTNIETYCRFMADEYGGWTTPDVRIFYKNGKVIEIN